MGYLLHFCYKIAPGHYCARFYDPATAIFPQQAPLAEKYYNISPYAYCANNPVNFVNLGGKAWCRVLKVARKVYKTVKTGTKVSVKGILKSEALDIADNVYTILDANASGLEKGFAAFDLLTGFGDEAKWAANALGVSDAIVDGARVVDGIKFKSFTERNIKDNPTPTTDQLFHQARKLMI